jgi:hypothetical protein
LAKRQFIQPTFMSFFARQNRYLARGTRLMIHERKLSKKLVITAL